MKQRYESVLTTFYLCTTTFAEIIDYPPPIVPEGGDFQYEFPSGRGLENQEPPYEPGSPHWCTEEMLATGHWDSVCRKYDSMIQMHMIGLSS